MDDQSKTKQVLSQELSLLRQKIAELEQSESDRKNKYVEGALRNSEEELASIYENAPLIMLLVDKEWTIRKTNAFTAQFVGRAAGDMINLRCGDSLHCIHSLDAPEGCGFGPSCGECTLRLTAINTIETGQGHHEVEASMSLSDGEKKREVIFLLSTARLTIKRQPMALVSMQDITERRRMEEEKHHMEECSRKVVEDIFRFIPEGVLVFSRKMELLRQNQAFQELVTGYAGRLGFAEDELENLIIDKVKTGLRDNNIKEIRISRKHETREQT